MPADRSLDLDARLALLGVDELRGLLRRITSDLGTGGRALIERAMSEVPTPPVVMAEAADDGLWRDVEVFCVRTRCTASADPTELDALFARIERAWDAGEHETVRVAIERVADVLGNGVDMHQDELYEEVLRTDLVGIAYRYLVSVYLTAPREARPAEIFDALEVASTLETAVTRPIEVLERTARTALPELDDFVRHWADFLRAALQSPGAARRREREVQDLLREATLRADGTAGLAARARRTREHADYDAWIRALRERGQLEAAAEAAREGAAVVGESWVRVQFLTTAARVEAERGRSPGADLARAFETSPSIATVCRWLGALDDSSLEAAAIGAFARTELPDDVRVLLSAIAGAWDDVAALAGAPGTASLVAGAAVWALDRDPTLVALAMPGFGPRPARRADRDATIASAAIDDPSPRELLDRARPCAPTPAQSTQLREAVRQVAARCMCAVSASGRRRDYDGAAQLVAIAAALAARAGEDASAFLDAQRREARPKWRLVSAIDEHAARVLGAHAGG